MITSSIRAEVKRFIDLVAPRLTLSDMPKRTLWSTNGVHHTHSHSSLVAPEVGHLLCDRLVCANTTYKVGRLSRPQCSPIARSWPNPGTALARSLPSLTTSRAVAGIAGFG